ncbi:MAG: hypothetical protein JHC64_03620 [Mycolicibacterium sp.]|nr:hypothetical protein [Mycolicibacterium sp.]
MLGSQHIAASYLAELCGTGASLAACVTKDSLVVVSTEANYFAPGCTDLTATGVCIETGPLRHVSKVRVRDADDRIIAEAIVTNAPPGPPSAD